jgi:nucleotide-binding universal stress UspA family protein
MEVRAMKPFVITSILAPTDLNETTLPALSYARLFADRFSAKLTVMYSDPILYPVDYIGPAQTLALMTTPEHQASLRAEVVRQARDTMNGRPYDIEIAVGRPVSSILAQARVQNADFIVMGSHARHGWRRALLGSVSEGVMHGSSCPVLTVATHAGHPSNTSMAITNILCPVNFTEVAKEALHVAARVAQAFAAHLTIVHVVEDANASPADEERIRHWIDPKLQDQCTYREVVVHGGAAERVLDCAEDVGADLLVVGAQHKLFRDATVIGTTTERLMRFAMSPVLVVPREAVPYASSMEEEQQLAGSSR